MEALLAREQAYADAAAASSSSAAKPKPKSAAKPTNKKRKDGAAEPQPSQQQSNFDDFFNDDDDDDEPDDELEENGFVIPDALTNPASDEEAKANIGRRIYIDGGATGRDTYTGEIIGWHSAKGQWQVELDRGDERLFVRSANLRRLDMPPPPKKKKKKKSTDAPSSAAVPDAKRKKPKK